METKGYLKAYELQEALRAKDTQLSQLTTANRTLEYELNKLRARCKEKEYELSRIIQDNQGLTTKLLQHSRTHTPSNHQDLERELLNKNQLIKSLDTRLNRQKQDSEQKLDFEVRRLSRLVAEGDKRLLELKNELENLPRPTQEDQLKQHLKTLTGENQALKEALREATQHLETQHELQRENEFLVQENRALKAAGPVVDSDLKKFSFDIHKICIEVANLLILSKAIQSETEFSLRMLFSSQDPDFTSTSQQVFTDLSSIKEHLKSIKEVISDYYAEQCGSDICNHQ